ncbi:hypothetical protein GCM10025794_21330 [Massilia kyonggiensis]
MGLEAIFKALIRMETDTRNRSSSLNSWEDAAVSDDKNGIEEDKLAAGQQKDIRRPIYIDYDLDPHSKHGKHGKNAPKFRLPTQPVQYVPQGNLRLAAEKIFDISPKAIFHILFGDKSAVWQLLLHERRSRGSSLYPHPRMIG